MDLSIVEKLWFGYNVDTENVYSFIGGVSEIKIFKEFIPNVMNILWNELMWFDFLCPFYCTECYRAMGR